LGNFWGGVTKLGAICFFRLLISGRCRWKSVELKASWRLADSWVGRWKNFGAKKRNWKKLSRKTARMVVSFWSWNMAPKAFEILALFFGGLQSESSETFGRSHLQFTFFSITIVAFVFFQWIHDFVTFRLLQEADYSTL
jgi:hypothetical protein